MSLPQHLGHVWLWVSDRPNGRVKANGDPGGYRSPAECEGNIAKCYGRLCAASVQLRDDPLADLYHPFTCVMAWLAPRANLKRLAKPLR